MNEPELKRRFCRECEKEFLAYGVPLFCDECSTKQLDTEYKQNEYKQSAENTMNQKPKPDGFTLFYNRCVAVLFTIGFIVGGHWAYMILAEMLKSFLRIISSD